MHSGRIPVGAALPPSRQLAESLGVSRWVVTEAYGQLVAEGFLDARTGSATRVSAAAGARSTSPRGTSALGERPTSPAGTTARRTDTGRTHAARARFDCVLSRLFEALERGPWLMGQRFTAVDIMAGSAVAWAREFLPASPAMDTYLERIMDRPANALAAAKDGPPPVLARVA